MMRIDMHVLCHRCITSIAFFHDQPLHRVSMPNEQSLPLLKKVLTMMQKVMRETSQMMKKTRTREGSEALKTRPFSPTLTNRHSRQKTEARSRNSMAFTKTAHQQTASLIPINFMDSWNYILYRDSYRIADNCVYLTYKLLHSCPSTSWIPINVHVCIPFHNHRLANNSVQFTYIVI